MTDKPEKLTIEVSVWNAYGTLEKIVEETKLISSSHQSFINSATRLGIIHDNMVEAQCLLEYIKGHQADIAKVLLDERRRSEGESWEIL